MSVRDHGLEAIRKSTIIAPDQSDPTEYAIRTSSSGGTFSIIGFNDSWVITTLSVGTTAIPLPATALTDRNGIAIRNLSETDTLYLGNSDVEANEDIGTTAGWQVGPNETYNIGITDNVTIYGIVASGTIKVQIKETK